MTELDDRFDVGGKGRGHQSERPPEGAVRVIALLTDMGLTHQFIKK